MASDSGGIRPHPQGVGGGLCSTVSLSFLWGLSGPVPSLLPLRSECWMDWSAPPISGAQRPARKCHLEPESPSVMTFHGVSAAPGAAGSRFSSFFLFPSYLYFILFEMCKSTCVSVTWVLLALGAVLLLPSSRSTGIGVGGAPCLGPESP